MRIAVITRALPAHGGGGMERLTADLAASWAASGHTVTCFTTPLPDGGAEELEREGVRVRTLPGSPGRYTRAWRRAVGRTVDPTDFDVVVGVSSAAASLVRPFAASATPVVMQAHGTALAEIASKLRAPSPRAVLGAVRNASHLLEDWFHYPRYSAVIAVSRGVAEDLQRAPRRFRPRRVVLIPNGVDPSLFAGASAADARDGSAGPAVLVFVGRLVKEKGADLLVRTLATSPHTAVVVGGGPQEARLRRLAERSGAGDRVEFTGAVDRATAARRMASADVVVVPSRRREGLPLVVLEALATGRRLVVSRQIAASLEGVLDPRAVLDALTPAALDERIAAVLAAPAPPPGLPAGYALTECADAYLRTFRDLEAGRAVRAA